MSFKNKIFYMRCQKPAPLKTLFEALHHVIVEAPFRITGKTDKSSGSIEMCGYDASLSVYVILELKGHTFDSFYCKYEKVDIGIDIETLHSMLKSMDSNELILSIDESSKDVLNINFEDVVHDKKSKTELKLLVLDYDDRQKQDKDFSVYIKMNCVEFNKICKELSSLSEFVEVKCTASHLIFTSVGDKARREVSYGTDLGSLKIIWNNEDVRLIQGYYELKNIVLFNKFNTMYEEVLIHLKSDYLMTIDFMIGTHGNLLVAITPVNSDIIKNSSYAYSDDEEEIIVETKNKVNDDSDEDEIIIEPTKKITKKK